MGVAPEFVPYAAVDSGATAEFLAALRAVRHELRRHEPVRHARHLASLWNVPLGEAGRATLFYADGAAVLVLVPANRKISAPTLRTLLGASELRVLRGDRGVGRVGWVNLHGPPGALPAIPRLFNATVLVDELALAPRRIILSLDAGVSVAVAPADYITLANGRVAQVAGRTKLPDRVHAATDGPPLAPVRGAILMAGDTSVDQPNAEPMLAELNRFVGEWTMVAGPPDGPPWPGEARVRFEWLDGGAFLVERWTLDAAGLPEGTPTSGTSVYGCDLAHGTYFQLFYDNRGEHRVYEMGLNAGEWTLQREAPPFAQRFRGTFSADGKTIAGRWEIKEPGEDWRIDFNATYTRTV